MNLPAPPALRPPLRRFGGAGPMSERGHANGPLRAAAAVTPKYGAPRRASLASLAALTCGLYRAKIDIGEIEMATGTVKWFNPTKGYGFIQPTGGGGGKDVFVHISAVEQAGLSTLNEGQTVEYELESNRGKESAVRLKVR
jgi:CspA family cold shock protein